MKPPSRPAALPFYFSLLASGAAQRLAGAAVLIAGLWVAVFWALH